MGRLKGQFQALLGQTVTSLARVALAQNDNLSQMMDTLLFICNNNRTFELLVEQDTVKFEELSSTNDLFASFELEPNEQLIPSPCTGIAKIPQTIASLTEIWAREGETEFLVAISFSDENKNHIISVCTEGDEAELMINLEELWQRTDDMIFSYGTLSHQLYTSPKDIKDTAVSKGTFVGALNQVLPSRRRHY
ncbi:hypothetical protein NIES4071_24170 [Calothrix sp. NIES-4071]|nr:hypothetical protein NIES4071_24170 [Calothrix sp. NIES-4071]BAZ56740.1 hypothetical protein NIES4105_24110 [Calothrix sp. NIES-4105]